MLALGGAVALVEPGVNAGRLTRSGRRVFMHVARAFLDGALPAADADRSRALAAFLQRTDALIAALPRHAQAELSQLLALAATAPGRRALVGLTPDWPDASVAQLRDALQEMRLSKLALRQQAYHALHDITGAAYYSDASTWPLLGYPGPVAV